MFLVDTSAWVEYLRKTGSPAHLAVRQLLVDGQPVALTEPVVMELLAGPTRPQDLGPVEALVAGLPSIPVDTVVDYHEAARIYRTVRGNGQTVRKLLDCLIAAVALRTGATLVHDDRDFDAIARCYPLRVLPEST